MNVIEAITRRKSIRRFKPDPVPHSLLEDILRLATCSPSAMNTQPWGFTVVTGAALERIRKGNLAAFESGIEGKAEIPHIPFQGVYRQRQVDLAIKLFQLMDIKREDKEKRKDWQCRGFRFFDAPAAIFLTMERSLDASSMSLLDMGAAMQTLCLAALDRGLATCIEDQGAMFPDVAHKHAGIPDDRRIIISIAIGYPDPDFPANRVESGREPVSKVVTWVE